MNINIDNDFYEILQSKQIIGESGSGFVKVIMRGDHRIEKIEYEDNELITKDISMFVDLIIFAYNDACKKLNDIIGDMLIEKRFSIKE